MGNFFLQLFAVSTWYIIDLSVHAPEKQHWYRLSCLYQILYRFLDTFYDRGLY